MPEIVAVPAPQVTEVWVIENHEIEFLGLEPQPPVELIVVQQIEVIALVDTGKGDQGIPGPPGESQIVFARDYEVTVTQGKQAYRFPFNAVLVGVSACMGLPCLGSPTIIDINIDGVSIFTNPADRPQIPEIEGDLPEITLNVSIVPGNRVTIDTDDIGSTLAGEDLTVFIRYEKA